MYQNLNTRAKFIKTTNIKKTSKELENVLENGSFLKNVHLKCMKESHILKNE